MCCSKRKQRKCIKCKDTTPHLSCTHWLHCNDFTIKKRAQYKIYICLTCDAESSSCRECSKPPVPISEGKCSKSPLSISEGNKQPPCPTYLWGPNKNGKTNYSLKCLKCGQRWVRCDYCKVLLSHASIFQIRKSIHPIVLLGFIQALWRRKGETQHGKLQVSAVS